MTEATPDRGLTASMSDATVDRLLGNATVLNIRGRNYCMRNY